MNILFIGPYRQADGWGNASVDYIRSLLKTKHNIVIRPIYLCQHIYVDIASDLKALEQKQCPKYDIVIQHALPNYITDIVDVTNISLAHFETTDIKNSSWIRRLNWMNYNIVSSKFEQAALEDSGVNNTVVIPMPIDTSIVKNVKGTLKIPQLKDNFVFYFIGEHNPRKNIPALLLAFHREFRRSEPVQLVLKLNSNGPAEALAKKVNESIASLKERLRIYKNLDYYKKEIVITERFDETKLAMLHNQCDCFVSPSYGEACCRPAMDAMLFGNTPIVNKNTGMSEFVDNKCGALVDSYEIPIFIDKSPIDDIYDAAHSWYDIDILDLQLAMRHMYEMDTKMRQIKIDDCKTKIKKYSYTNIARRINKLLKVI